MKHKIIESTMLLLLVSEVEGVIAGNNGLPSASFMVYFGDYLIDHAVESR
jgi:hypothetical protein